MDAANLRQQNHIMIFEQFIMPLDTPNSNGRIYLTQLVQRVIVEQANNMQSRALLGEFGPKTESVIHLNNVSHLITNMYIRDGNWYAHIDVIAPPMGRVLRDLIDSHARLRWWPAGTGTFMNGSHTIDPMSYQFITINVSPY